MVNTETLGTQPWVDKIKEFFAKYKIIIVSFLLGLLIIGAIIGYSITRETTVRQLIIGELKKSANLTTVVVDASATVKESSFNKVLWFIPIGSSNVIYEGNGTITAGINFQDIEIKEDNPLDNSIKVELPPPQIITSFLHINNSKVVDDYTLWWGSNDKVQLLDKAQKESLKRITDKACNKKILEAANDNAKEVVYQILSKTKYKNIEILTQEPTECKMPDVL